MKIIVLFFDDSKEWQGISQYIPNGGQITERGFNYTIECIKAMKDVLGDEVGLALDLGPGINPSDALKIAKVVEDLNIMWLEDMITGTTLHMFYFRSLPRCNKQHNYPNPYWRTNLFKTQLQRFDR